MTLTPNQFYTTPNSLAQHYKRFSVDARILLTGHSHQAWPDVSRDAQLLAWDDAAQHVDDKWARAAIQAEAVRKGFARLLDDDRGEIALGASTHELLIRFLSALPWRTKPRIITTTGEFHSARRQLDRLAEEGIEIVRVPSDPPSEVADHINRELNHHTAVVIVSTVFYHSGLILPRLTEIYEACQQHGAELLLDVYHHLNVVPFSIRALGLNRVFAVGGGYKYCQLGEGNGFLRFPRDCELRPVLTGWFAEHSTLNSVITGHQVSYDPGPARFAGATYDPSSHYRAASVFDFFTHHGLTPELLREVSQHQIAALLAGLVEVDPDPELLWLDTTIPVEQRAGFLALKSPFAAAMASTLAPLGVHVDSRGQYLRLGPAPYLCDVQLDNAVDRIAHVLARIQRSAGL